MRRKLFLLLMLIPAIVWLSGGCSKKPAQETIPAREVTECTETISAPSDTTSTFTFTLRDDLEKTTVPEAEDIMGMPVPTPLCLPDGYEIKETYIRDNPENLLYNDVLLLISDETIQHQGSDTNTKLVIDISFGCGPPMRPEPELGIEGVRIRDNPRTSGAFISNESITGGDHNELLYQFKPSFWNPKISDYNECLDIKIMSITDIPKEDLVKIAASTLY